VVLLEVVPAGRPPSLGRAFPTQALPAGFREASREVGVSLQKVAQQADEEAEAPWRVLEPTSAAALGGTVLTGRPDASLLASGPNPSPQTYTVTAETDLTGITAVRLEVLPDPSLPFGGPGRVYNGNIALNEFRVTAAPKGDATSATPVVLRNAVADFSQTTYGGWPVAAAIDGDPQTAWSVDPEEGWPHAAVFETAEQVGFPGGTVLTFTLDQQPPKEHSIGRFRLSVATTPPPIPLGRGYGRPKLRVTGRAPASSEGGTLVVSAEMLRGNEAFMVGDAGTRLTATAHLGGAPATCDPVIRSPSYPVSWQAWRIALPPSQRAQGFELMVTANTPPDVQVRFQGHYVPASR